MAIREGAWDCPSCGRTGNRGSHKHCGGCGAPRGLDVAFYLPEDAPEVTAAAELARAQAGPDWNCSFCEGDNPGDNQFCGGCGASKEGAAPRPVVEHRAKPVQPPAPPARKRSFKLGCVLSLVGLVLALVLAQVCFGPKKETLTVTGHRWERAIAVEAQQRVTEEGWEGELPAGARSLASQRTLHHVDKIEVGRQEKTRTVSERVQTGTEKVKVGVRDLGNGYFEDVFEDRPVYETVERQEKYFEPVYREQPVYKNRVRYEVDKWVSARTAKAGDDGLAPAWPNPRLASREREGKRTARYVLLLADPKGRSYTWETGDEGTWKAIQRGQALAARVRDGQVVELALPGR